MNEIAEASKRQQVDSKMMNVQDKNNLIAYCHNAYCHNCETPNRCVAAAPDGKHPECAQHHDESIITCRVFESTIMVVEFFL